MLIDLMSSSVRGCRVQTGKPYKGAESQGLGELMLKGFVSFPLAEFYLRIFQQRHLHPHILGSAAGGGGGGCANFHTLLSAILSMHLSPATCGCLSVCTDGCPLQFVGCAELYAALSHGCSTDSEGHLLFQ